MLFLLALGCGGASAPGLEGCWEVMPKRTSTECFDKGGVYRLDSKKLGEFEGTWSTSGASIEIAVGGFPADEYTFTIEGDTLKLANEHRKMELVRAGAAKPQ